MSKYHIVMPWYRKENAPFYEKNLEGFVWHRVENKVPDFKDPAYAKINWFIQNEEIVDEDYYHILMDDDALPDGFFSLMPEIEGDLVVFSLARGQNIPSGRSAVQSHPTEDLIAEPKNMRVGGVGLQQVRFRGSIFKKLVCEDSPYADGILVGKLYREAKYEILYVPQYFIKFNYLEPGRWDK